MNRPCPLCFSENLHEFSHWTACDDGMREVKKIMCSDCQCEAPIKYWNVRVSAPTVSNGERGECS